ncbi:MAG TPA: hypothetical protein VKZ50_03855 [bacterium]|nr:hypothetical protein [bacterium]
MSDSTTLPPGRRQTASQDHKGKTAGERVRGPARIRWIRHPKTVVERHQYRQGIEDLLAAGWAPRTLNTILGRLHSDYVPVPDRTLRWHREYRLPKTRFRPAEAYERMLRDDQVLLDTVREKAALVVLQKARLSRTLVLEERLPGIVLPQVGHEMDRLVKLVESYERSLEVVGLLPNESRGPTVTVSQTVNVHEVVEAQLAGMPAELREQLGRWLERARLARVEARLKPIEARVRNVPAPIDEDGDPDRGTRLLEAQEEESDNIGNDRRSGAESGN